MNEGKFISVNLSTRLVREIVNVLSGHETLGEFSNRLNDILIEETTKPNTDKQLTFDFYK